MDSEKQDTLKKNIENLKIHVKDEHPSAPGIKTLENVGDHSFVIKLNTFNDFDLNITIQIPSIRLPLF